MPCSMPTNSRHGHRLPFEDRVNRLSLIDTLTVRDHPAYQTGLTYYSSRQQAILLSSSDQLLDQKNVTSSGFFANLYHTISGKERPQREQLLYNFQDSVFILKIIFLNSLGEEVCNPRWSSCLLIASDTILSSAHVFQSTTKTTTSAIATLHRVPNGSSLASVSSYTFPSHTSNKPIPFGTIVKPEEDFALLEVHLPNHDIYLLPSSPNYPRSTMRLLGYNFRFDCEQLSRLYKGEVEPYKLAAAIEQLAPMRLSVGSSEGLIGTRVPVGPNDTGRSRFLREAEGCDLVYMISTTAGSSGSAIFDADNKWIGVHHGALITFDEEGNEVIDVETFNHGICLRHPTLRRFVVNYLNSKSKGVEVGKTWSLLR